MKSRLIIFISSITSYIKSHLNFDVMLKLLVIMDDININQMKILKPVLDEYIRMNIYRLLESSMIILYILILNFK